MVHIYFPCKPETDSSSLAFQGYAHVRSGFVGWEVGGNSFPYGDVTVYVCNRNRAFLLAPEPYESRKILGLLTVTRSATLDSGIV